MLQLIATMKELPTELLYFFLGLGAFLENLFPPLPADTLVLVGGAVSGSAGILRMDLLFLILWLTNISGALIVYGMGFNYGHPYFQKGRREKLLNEEQLKTLESFYHKNGLPVLFCARFIPGFRVLVPIFAGITHLGPFRVLVPIASASAIWYSLLLYAGWLIGENISAIAEFQGRLNLILGSIAVILIARISWWWKGTRRNKQ